MNDNGKLWLILLVALLVFPGCVTSSTGVPSSFYGFVGSLEGRVVSVHQNVFIMKVNRVVQLREDNRAPRPGSVRNQNVAVHADVVTDQYSQRHPVPAQQAFINSLSPGDRVVMRVGHQAGNHLRILQLSRDQRAQAGY